MNKKTEITFELEETFTLRKGGKPIPGYCPRCQHEVGFVLPTVLAVVAGTSEREIFRLVETGAIHFVEAEQLVVCPRCYNRLLLGDGTGRAERH